MRVVFMGSPGSAVPSLERLVTEGYEVAAVYTRPDRPAGRGRATLAPPVKAAAGRLGIPVVQPEDLVSGDEPARLAAFRPEVIVVCAYGQILPREVLEMPPFRCVNVHFSRLPRHRGAAPVAAAILAGDEFAGVSLILLEKRLDAGPLLVEGAIPVKPEDTAGTLTEKLAVVGAGLLLEALSGWTRGEITPRPQDDGAATYCREVGKDAGRIDWRRPAVEIWRMVRAYHPWPGAFTTWRGRQLKILEAEPLAWHQTQGTAISDDVGNFTLSLDQYLVKATIPCGRPDHCNNCDVRFRCYSDRYVELDIRELIEANIVKIGQVLFVNDQRYAFGVLTTEGILGVLKLQLAGKRAMTAGEFLRGQRDFIGSELPS
jgi:methionyl-tRNA formyltransferase